MNLICHACKHDIALITEDIATPLRGTMFRSKDPKHGVPAPWSPVVTWEYMYCPMCGNRAFLLPERGNFILYTNKGVMVVDADGISPLIEVDNDEKEILEESDPLNGEVEKDSEESTEETSKNEVEEANISEKLALDAEELIGTEASADTAEAKEQEADPQPSTEEQDVEPEKPQPVTFEEKIGAGEIIQNGSWFMYKGKNYRMDELKKIFKA